MLDALAHAHRAGIVHRDVKPANILLEDRDEIAVRLLDFGLAQFDGADTLTAVGDVPGTLAYIAPERLAGADADPESDVWSVGVLLWETLADRHPFWGVPIQEVARGDPGRCAAARLAAARTSPPLVTAVDAALAIDPSGDPTRLIWPRSCATPRGSRRVERRATSGGRGGGVRRPGSPPCAPRASRRAAASCTAALGATFLPFWPPELVALLVIATGLACWLDPRLGLALALAAPIFPLGNVARSRSRPSTPSSPSAGSR